MNASGDAVGGLVKSLVEFPPGRFYFRTFFLRTMVHFSAAWKKKTADLLLYSKSYRIASRHQHYGNYYTGDEFYVRFFYKM